MYGRYWRSIMALSPASTVDVSFDPEDIAYLYTIFYQLLGTPNTIYKASISILIWSGVLT